MKCHNISQINPTHLVLCLFVGCASPARSDEWQAGVSRLVDLFRLEVMDGEAIATDWPLKEDKLLLLLLLVESWWWSM